MPLTREDLVRELDHALDRVDAGWSGWPSVLGDRRLSDRERLAGLLLIMQTGPSDVDGWPAESEEGALVRSLQRRSLPWDSATAVFALEAAISADCVHHVSWPALRGAEQAIETGHADAALYSAVSACAERLDRLGDRWGAERDRRQARHLLSMLLPPGLLDLSALHDGDHWAEPARSAARTYDPDDVEPLVRVLAELGQRTPPQSWQKKMMAALSPASARLLLAEWVRLAAETQEFNGNPAPFVFLFVPSNGDLVRAAVIAARWLRPDEISSELIGALCRRGAATRPPSTESLAHKVSSAAIDTLASRAASTDIAELMRLLEDLRRRDLLKKIGAALGPSGVARAAVRDAEIKREKAIDVRLKGAEARKIVDAEVDRMLEVHVNDTLREFGFRSSGRVWRRFAGSRVDLVDFYNDGSGWVSARFGVLFEDLHPKDGPADRIGGRGVKSSRLDLLVTDFGEPMTAESLGRLEQRLRDTIEPFLTNCGDRAFLTELLTVGTGVPADADTAIVTRFTGPRLSRRPYPHQLALGALACAAGDRISAEWWLDAAEKIVAQGSGRSREELEYWRRRVENLPSEV